MRSARSVLALLLVLAAPAGATGAPAVQADPAAGAPRDPPAWPAPPARPRIRFLRPVARPADLGVRRSPWRRLAELFTGPDDAWLVRPTGVACAGDRLYVADPGSPALWILDPAAGSVRRIGRASGGPLASPVAVAAGRGGRVFVADSQRATVLVFDAEGKPEGAFAHERFRRPAGLAYDAARDRLYVADPGAHGVAVFAGDGRPLGWMGRRGAGPGEFNFPTHLAVDGAGALLVNDSLNFRVQALDGEGAFLSAFGRQGDASGALASPKGVAVDGAGRVYVVDALFDAVQIFDRQGRFLLGFGERGVGPGQLWLPGGIALDGKDRIYVADSYNRRIQVFEYLGGDDHE